MPPAPLVTVARDAGAFYSSKEKARNNGTTTSNGEFRFPGVDVMAPACLSDTQRAACRIGKETDCKKDAHHNPQNRNTPCGFLIA